MQKMENAKEKGADNQGHLLQVCTIKPLTLKVMSKKKFLKQKKQQNNGGIFLLRAPATKQTSGD